jgi:hypothetical protein
MSGLNTMAELGQPWGEAMMQSAQRVAVGELTRACGVWPTWPTRLTEVAPNYVAGYLRYWRTVNDGKAVGIPQTSESIIMEEIMEVIEAAQRGDLDAARTECIQAMAMLLRLYVHLPHYCKREQCPVKPEDTSDFAHRLAAEAFDIGFVAGRMTA